MKIYKDYDQQQLDDQYNTRLRVPDFANYFERWEQNSEEAVRDNGHVTEIAYGEDPLERLDVFPAAAANAPVLIFIHGGYWHLLDKSQFHFLAVPFVQKNITTVLINYPLAPAATIDQMVACCDRAVSWVAENISSYHGDPDRIFVAGHSAGGHLAAMLLTQDTRKRIKGVIALSGIFRLEPVYRSFVNEAVQMSEATALRNSPVSLQPVNPCPLLLVTGTEESDEFQAQTEELYACWKEQSKLLKVSGRNHYSILDTLVEEGSEVAFFWDKIMEA